MSNENLSSEQKAYEMPDQRALTVDETVWLQAWCAVAGAFNSDSDAATRWADKCLDRFNARFRK